MKARKIDKIVLGCGDCPYAHFESEVGETFCTCEEEAFSLNHMVYHNQIHKDCPLDEIEIKEIPITPGDEFLNALGLDPNTTAGVACCDDEDISFNRFGCAQMMEVSGIPPEWLDKLVLSEDEREKIQKIEDEWIEGMINECGVESDTFDQCE
jgi:hypothetical protein